MHALPSHPAPATGAPERSVALPLKVGADGRLDTSDPWDALGALVRVMFSTSVRAWAHAPWFGLHEFVSERRTGEDDVKEALNLAFGHLGLGWASVASVAIRKGPGGDERFFTIEFAGTGPWDGYHSITL